MNVVFCTDNNYVIPCGIAITSLLENNKDGVINIYILGLNLNENGYNSFKQISIKYKAEIEMISIDQSYLSKYNLPLSGLASSKYITLASYVRLFLTDILPACIDKILYLDCDLFINKNLKELYDISIEGYSLAGVIDQHMFLPSIKEYFKRLEYQSENKYINAGVLLINLKYWREHSVLNKFLSFIQKKRDSIQFHDQDVINGVLNGSCCSLPLKYNVQSQFYQRDLIARLKNENNKYLEDLICALKFPVIIHFTTFYTKPWLKGSLHPKRKDYNDFQEITEWKDTPKKWANNKFSTKFKYYKRKCLTYLRLKKSKYVIVDENDNII